MGKLKLHVLSGFLGSGKTTAIQLACMAMKNKNVNAAVITNDQGMKLVDSAFFKAQRIPLRQVVNGCFCCKFQQLETSIQSLIENTGAQTIFAESVGSCTDIVATVINPLLAYQPDAQLSFSVFADARLLYQMLKGKPPIFEESVNYIFFKQLEEAGLIVVNKIDLIATEPLNELKKILDKQYPEKSFLFQNSLNEESIELWLDELEQYSKQSKPKPLSIDYDIYAAGEAQLAWVDQELQINSVGNNAPKESVKLLNLIYKKIREAEYAIGHLKFILDDERKISFTASSPIGMKLEMENKKANGCKLLINARVQAKPEAVELLITDAIKEIEKYTGNKIISNSLSAFQPGYPRPTHRMAT